jgi:DNA-binding GntR family transcriptional regulator
MAVRRRTLGDEVYEAITAKIMDHSIAPGERIGIDALARDLEVSPTPVREALARLEADGLVGKRPMVGYNATALLTRDEFEQLFEVRLLLEPAAAGNAAARGATVPTPSAVADGYAAFTAADADFHDAIALASGNPLLADSLIRLHAHLHLHRLYLPTDPVTHTAGEHDAVVAAIHARRPDEAAAAMTGHLVAARERHRRYWDA